MNRRFTLKFIKYIFLFLASSIFLMIIGLILFFYNFNILFYNSMEDIDADYLINGVTGTRGDYAFSENFQNMLEESDMEAYIVDDEGDAIHPENAGNLKQRIFDNLWGTMAMPYKEGEHVILIKETPENLSIQNSHAVDMSKLINSLYLHNHNAYQYYIEDDGLYFTENPLQRDYVHVDEFSERDITLFKRIGIILLVVPALNILITVIMAILLSRRISRPLFFYIDWIEQLARGRLYKPGSEHNHKRGKKLFQELDTSLETLNAQLIDDHLYQNQISYYREKWISQITHDLKSPLTSIYGYSKILAQYPVKTEAYSGLISEKAKYMEQLIDGLNHNFKIETSQMNIDREAFSIVDLLNGIKQTIGYRHMTVTHDLVDSEYYGNRLYLERMFVNLIDNSIEHNRHNPDISIHVRDTEDDLIIDYRDNGHGIGSMDMQAFRGTSSTKKEREGHGIGGSIILDAIDFHNGELSHISKSSGLHFVITLSKK
ncbi:HAMP domain-containing histidine kinase [Salinicoccus sp. ID82-1]|uniref:histidine kinase n=1 Tax=Salinicoccus cyprini TaxID=2493691 RepID=A0A558AV00_9STAP|nr:MULTISPECIES: HAMP domain-containing sensor histidine kinase [Salinicoccus]MCG1010541.1 HAMP domain-containing histidine kinase [Salinicoccus sp. ID82-1]TVT28091.1 HAMP domain-containing histidine kinase [Salinicoccus cyprini]